MSLTSPIPVLCGSGGAVLQSEGDGLVLSRSDMETRIPLRAVRRIRAEGRAVAVELTAQAGAAPAVHRVAGVSEAAASVFADAVNAILPESAGEAVDGSALVTVRAAPEPAPLSRQERKTREFRIWLAAVVLLAVVLAVVVWITASASLALPLLVVVPFGAAVTTGGIMGLRIVRNEWYLPRKGVTVEAARRHDTTPDQFGGTGNYTYTDLHGHRRVMFSQSRADVIRVAYHPEKPGTAVACQSLLRRTGWAVVVACILLLGLAVDTVVMGVVIGSLQGRYDGYTYTAG
ncbi:hypothetical protein ACFW9D_04075 [Streptomyces sp. NPDC059524]|uniref:hypothetical protein n=1 Tax=Streptomyces sp. NPDC059524 TaxID=3346856 RepID=UPI00367B3FA6